MLCLRSWWLPASRIRSFLFHRINSPETVSTTGTWRHSPWALLGLSQSCTCLFISCIVFENAFQCLYAGLGIASHLVKICQSQVCGRIVGIGFDGFVVELPRRGHVSLSKPNLCQTSSNLGRWRPRVNRFLQHLGCLRRRLGVSHQKDQPVCLLHLGIVGKFSGCLFQERETSLPECR